MSQSDQQMQLDDMGTIGPGRYLLHARQNKKLRIEDVAIELKLTPDQVVALEEDDYSRMPEVTYVRGYLRNYARLLGLSGDDILMAHSRITRNDDQGVVAVSPVSEREIHATGPGIVILGILILVAVIGAAGYWYLDRDDELATAEKQPVPAMPAVEEVPTGSSKLSFDEPAPVESEAEPVAQASTDEPNHSTAFSVPEEVPADPVAAVQVISIEQGEAESVEAAATEQPADETPQDAAQDIPTEEPVADNDIAQLVISYDKSCWTDIRDATGNKLIYRTVPAGETVNVEGQKPLSLFFGFAVGVDLTYNGEPIDLKQHTDGVFARLTLGD